MPLLEAVNLGVKFTVGAGREDAQSWTYRTLVHRKKREQFWALENVSLTGSAGDIIGLIGANGAGKTTLCRVLAGLIRPDAGTLAVNGTTSALLSLGTGFNPDLSGRENVILNGLMLGLSRREVAGLLPRIVEFAGLGAYVDQPLKHYSTGMKSRLGFSIGAMIEPEILILDETLSAGDREFSVRAGERLRALIASARLVVVVTHHLAFAGRYCTRAVWLDRGRICAVGPADEIVAAYDASIGSRRPSLPDPRVRTPVPGTRPLIVARQLAVRFRLRRATREDRDPRRSFPILRPRRPRTFAALEDVSLTLNEGEVLGIVGRNGAGKSTLCRVLRGLLAPDAGRVDVAGDVTALLTLSAGFNRLISGRDNIYLNGMLLGMSRRRLRGLCDEIIAFSGLSRFIDEPVKHYSPGMRTRLGFAVAAKLEPDILVLDEVLSAGDGAFQQKAALAIQELMTRAKAVVVVTHNLAFVETVCTRALWLDGGRVRFDGAPAETVARYRRATVKA